LPVDLFELAREKAPALADRCQEIVDAKQGDDRAAIDAFGAMLQQAACVGVNMHPARLAALLEGEPYLNAHELAARQGAEDSQEYEAELRRVLKSWYDARVTFTTAYAGAKEFKYGAANTGNAGALHYGAGCAILKHQDWASLAVLPHDSLVGYVRDGAVAADDIQADVGPWESRRDVATIKLHGDACDSDETRWPRLVCSDEEYIEAIFVGAVTVDEVREVRFTAQERQDSWELAMGLTAASLRDDVEHVHAMHRVEEATTLRGIPLETVPDD